jgi:superfamily II DNA or RNA helicase
MIKTPNKLQAISYGAMAMVPFNHELKELLTKTDKFGEDFALYQHKVGQPNALVARGLASRATAEFDHTILKPVAQSIAVVGPRNAEQAEVITKSLDLLKNNVDHIVEAPTGFGKTYVGASVAGQLGQATLIVVTKNDLVQPWKTTLTNLLGVDPKEIGHVQQNKCKFEGCKFVVAMIQSLVCREYPQEFYDAFGLVIFDEVHRLGAEYFAQACGLFRARHRLGLSATPTRKDGRTKLFEAHIGPVMVKGTWVPMSPKILVKKTGWKVPKVPRRDENGQWKSMPMEVIPGRMANVYKAIAADVERNRTIADMAAQAVQSGRYVLILSDLLEGHLNPLFHYVVEAGVPGELIGFYHGTAKKPELERAKSKKVRVVLATYHMTSEGTDVPHWDTLIMATPRSDVKQSIGRVLRTAEDKKQPVVFDLRDDHAVLEGFYFSRLKQYYSVGGTIVEV